MLLTPALLSLALLTPWTTALAAPFTFVVVGDTQTDGEEDSVNWDVLPELITDMNTHDPAFGLFAGDLVGGSSSLTETERQWGDFHAATAHFTGTVLAVPGNHDVYPGAGTFGAWRRSFPELPQEDSPPGEEGISYVVDHENVRFISITSAQETGVSARVSTEGLAWLDVRLKERDAFDHVFVFTHYPMTFSDENNLGGSGGDFWKMLVAYGVTGVFSGHWHRYQPSQPGAGGDTWETIIGTGGGWTGYDPIRAYQQMWGFGVVMVDGPEATLTFYADADGDGRYDDAVDSFVLASAAETEGGLVARYTFDDGLDDDAPDGRQIPGALHRGAELVDDGVTGSALQLTGTDDYLEAGAIDDYVLSINEDLTISLWARLSELSSSGLSSSGLSSGEWANTLLCYATNDYYTEDEETNYSYWLSIREGHLQAFWEHGSGENVQVLSGEPASLTPGVWHHVAVTRDADAMTVQFWVDGEKLGPSVPFERLPTGGGRGMLYLGSDTPAFLGNGYEWDGALDEVCIYDRALGSAEIAELAALTDCAVVGEPDQPGTSTTGGTTGTTGESTGGSETGGTTATDTDDDTGESAATSGGASPGWAPDTEEGCGCASGSSLPAAIWVSAWAGLSARRRRRS